MKKNTSFFTYLIIYSFLTFPQMGMAQDAYLDSLKTQYEITEGIGERMDLLRSIAREEPETSQKIAYANELLDLAKEHDSYYFQHSAELQLGIGFRFLGDLSQSLEHLLISLEIARSNNDDKLIGSSYGEIAATYASQGDVSTSVQFANKAIQLFENRKDTLNLAIALLNTAYDYYTINKLDSSMIYGMKADQLASNFSDLSETRREALLAYIRGNMGITQAANGDEENGIAALKESIISLRSIDDYYAVADFMKFLGEIEFKIGNVEASKTQAIEALGLAERYELLELQRDLNLLLFRINQHEGNAQSALNYHLAYTTLKDSIENKNVIRQMAQQRSAFELSQKETEVQLLKAQRRNQQAVLVIATVVVFAFAILVIVIFIYYRNKIRVNRVLKRQKVTLERLNETKDKFFSIISHDLRGPIASLFGVGQLIRHFVHEDNKSQLLEMAGHMESSVDRLSALLDNLLNWAMQQQGHFPNVPEKVNITDMIREIVEMFSNMASGKKLEIECLIEEPLFLWIDRNSIHTVFRNLINNAIKFTPDGGSIKVSALVDQDMAEIRVEDTGVGIPKSKLKKLFKLSDKKATFGTAGEKGLGLGLQLVKEFMEMNNGEILAESAEGKGTTFIVRLPLFDEAEVAETVSSHSFKTE